MPFIGESYFYHARIGRWKIEETESTLRAGIDVSSATMARINSSKSSSRRAEILASRRIMHRMGISDHNVIYSPQGKPMMRNGMYISISHSHGNVCVATSEYPIGIDIQKIDRKIKNVLSWFLHPKESNEKRRDELLRMALLWSGKEALYKLEGDDRISMRDFQIRLPSSIDREGYFPAILHRKGEKTKIYRMYYSHDDNYVMVHALRIEKLSEEY